MIHCIGDSHSAVFGGKEEMQPTWPEKSDDTTPYFRSYRIGPATAYQLETKIPLIEEIIRLNYSSENDYVLFCFGEVDIRAHILKQVNIKKRNYKDLVKECVDRYMSTILHFKNKGIRCIVWGPIASWHPSKVYGGPSYGNCLERNNVTKEFNEYIEKLCLVNGIGFISIFNDMIDENLITNPFYLDNWRDSGIHLSQTSMPLIIEKFKEKNYI
jgi:hypothetical protein